MTHWRGGVAEVWCIASQKASMPFGVATFVEPTPRDGAALLIGAIGTDGSRLTGVEKDGISAEDVVDGTGGSFSLGCLDGVIRFDGDDAFLGLLIDAFFNETVFARGTFLPNFFIDDFRMGAFREVNRREATSVGSASILESDSNVEAIAAAFAAAFARVALAKEAA